MDCVGTHYYRDVAYGGKTPEQIAIEELQRELEEVKADLTTTDTDLTTLTNDYNSFKDKFIIVYPTDTDSVVQQKINTPNVSKIIFATGTYNNITTTKRIPSNKTLIGYGATINIPASIEWVVFLNDTKGNVGGYNENENIKIAGFTFNAENANQTGVSIIGIIHSNNIVVKDCTFTKVYGGGHMVEFNACHACVVDSCYFYDLTGTEMIQLDQASDIGAFPVAPGPWDGTGCSAIAITNCTFENPQAFTAEHGANTFPAAIGIHNKGGSPSTHLKVVGNTFAHMTTALRFVKVASSVFNNNTAYGVYNFFSVGTDSGAATTANFSGNVISGNSINCAVKIDSVTVSDSYKYTAITYNGTNSVISNNQIWNASADGIIMRGQNNVIDGNRISDCGRSGISLVSPIGILVTTNHCSTNAQKNTDTSDADIRASGQGDCPIIGNIVNKMFIFTDKNGNLITTNSITQTLTNTGGIAHNNLINGAWIA